ncbi:MAG: Holliday junction resolvase RuvX [Candidatus Magasanikbacteria bacterium]|nr:Holliday junction resolvase RuvX [Candidatus Magasanikbacteria bacterium]
MNILGIDWGKKRVGLAWVQSGLDVVLPFGVIETHKVDPLAEIISIIREEKINIVVFGLPKTLSGAEQENALAVREVGEKVAEATGVKVDFLDERYSSRAADRFGADGASRDEKAAMIMVQAYLDQK